MPSRAVRGVSARPADARDEAAPREFLPEIPRSTSPQPVPEGADVDHPALYFNRELSWLDFNWRVLYQALDARVPLLERVRFLAIAANNLDEFFRKRVGGLKRQEGARVRILSPDGRTPTEQLALIRDAARVMHVTLTDSWERVLKPALRQEGILVENYEDLPSKSLEALHAYFQTKIFPILTPLAVDPGHPFPFISNLSLSLAVTLRHPTRGTEHFARLKVPTSRGRWLPLDGGFRYVPVEQVIKHNIGELFRGMEIVSVHAFRITRNADVRRNEEEAEDLLEMISEEVRERRFAPVVRLEVEKEMPEDTRELLLRELRLDPEEVYEVDGLLNLSDCSSIAELDRPDLRFEPWEPVVPASFLHEGESKEEEDIFTIIRHGEVLVHHPYESFRASVQRFIEEATRDEQVLAIKQTLYRTSDESPIVDALRHAAEQGKQVAVLIEVKARFDEENNIEWAQMLEKSGVHVTYGLVGLKTHCKTTLVIREEEGGLRTYSHIGTGNYHPGTARLYTDIGLFTADPDIGYDLINLFHYLTGYAPEQHYRRAIVAPRDLRKAFIELIHREIRHQQATGNGQIIAKMNALDDGALIEELYRASQAGVNIDLIVRGHCRLRPGLPGYSENIRVISIVGRFLEHTRIFYFHNGGQPLTYLASADWGRRNLDDRVEVAVPVDEPTLQARLIRILHLALQDNRLAWELQPDGQYIQRRPAPGEEERNFHEQLMKRARLQNRQAEKAWDFSPAIKVVERRPRVL